MSQLTILKIKDLQKASRQVPTESNLYKLIIGEYQTATIGKTAKQTKDVTLEKIIKKLKDSIEEVISLTGATTEQQKVELDILEGLLPKQLSEKEIEQIVINNQFTSLKYGMMFLKQEYPNQYDGAMASKLIKKLIEEA